MPQNRDKTAQANPPGQVTAPSVPASTVAQVNSTGQDVVVYIIAATLTIVQITAPGGSAQTIYNQASGNAQLCVVLPNNYSITLTYTGSPTWFWFAY